jgi:hypothetical protein
MTLNKFFSSAGLIIFLITQSLNGQIFRSGEADKIVNGSKLVRINPITKNIQFIQLKDDAEAEEKDPAIWLGKALKTSDKHSFKEPEAIYFYRCKYQIRLI